MRATEQVIAVAEAVFVVVDMEKKKPIVIPESIAFQYPMVSEHFFTEMKQIAPIKLWTKKSGLTIDKEDVDINNHVNNLVYIDWICQVLEELKSFSDFPEEFQISYLREVTYPAEISILCCPKMENEMICEIQSEVVHARERMKWKNH